MSFADQLRDLFKIPREPEETQRTPVPPSPTPISDKLRSVFTVPKEPLVLAPKTEEKQPVSLTAKWRESFQIPEPTYSPFVTKLQTATRSIVNTGAKAADKAMKEQGKVLTEFVQGKYKVGVSDVLEGLKDTAMGTASLAGLLAQGLNEGIARIGKSAVQTVAGEGAAEFAAGLIPDDLARSITGREKIDTYQTVYGKVDRWARDNGATRREAKNFAGLAVVGLVFADNPVSAPGKAALELSKDALEELAQAGTNDAVEAILRRENPGITDAEVQIVAPIFRQASTPNEVNEAARTINRTAARAIAQKPEPYAGESDLSTKILQKLEGRSTVSKQFIEDLTNSPDLKQAERDLIRTALLEEGDEVNVPAFAEKVKVELLPLERRSTADEFDGDFVKYESVSLPPELRGSVRNYTEHIYESPVKTSAGDIHFRDNASENYFGHTRVEDLSESDRMRVIEEGLKKGYYASEGRQGRIELRRELEELKKQDRGGTRRVIEVQSDLFQKDRLAQQISPGAGYTDKLDSLKPYQNNAAHFRMIREEVKQAALDGKTKLQFPTGKTAMQIEGLGDARNWAVRGEGDPRFATPNDLKIGRELSDPLNEEWVVIEVLGDGKFNAIPRDTLNGMEEELSQFGSSPDDAIEALARGDEEAKEIIENAYGVESFDISGKIDTENPIYKFYEKDVGRYLKNKYDAKLITDPKGVTWYEVEVNPLWAQRPVEAFKTAMAVEYNLTKEEAEKVFRDLFTDKEADFLIKPEIADGKAIGRYTITPEGKALIEVVEQGGKVSDQVVYHEAFHTYMRSFVAKEERERVLNLARKGNESIDLAEERLADDFAKYAKDQSTGGELTKFFKKTATKIKRWSGMLDEVTKVYDDIIQKRRDAEYAGVGGEAFKESPYKPSVNLMKELADLKNAGATQFEILKVLEREFPNLPDRVYDRFVNKIYRFKRSADIENMLRNAFEMNKSMSSKLSPEQKKVLDRTLPRSVADVMSDSEKIEYIQSVSRKVDNEEMAVLNRNEYDMIMDHADQATIDRYNDLVTHRGFLSDVLGDDTAAQLYNRYYRNFRKRAVDDATTTLRDIHDKARKKAQLLRNYEGGRRSKKPEKLTPNDELALAMDTEIEALGYADFDEAQEALDRYWSMKQQIKEMDQELAELRPHMQGAVMLRSLLDEMPVMEGKQVSVIDDLANTADVRDTYKDISGLNAGFRDVYRNFRRFFGARFPEIKRALLDPFDRKKGDFVTEKERLATALENGVTERFGIKRGSPEADAIQRFGDKDIPVGERLSLEDLVEKFGAKRADDIVQADKWFREMYDSLPEPLNEIRAKLYPNNPEKLVGFKKDYYHHYEEMDDSFGSALNNFFDTPSGITPSLVGISEETKPKSRFLPFQQTRKGQQTKFDAIEGFLRYAELYAYAKHIDPEISKFRYLRRKLADVAPTKGQELEMPDGTKFKAKGVENFLGFLDDFANDLSGKTNPVDRYVQKRVPGGRATMKLIDWVNSRIKANQILGNAGVMVAQMASFPQTIARNKKFALPGMQRTVATLLDNSKGPISESVFLKERYADHLKDRFPLEFKNNKVDASFDIGKKGAAWMIKAFDYLAGHFAWNSSYAKAVAEGVDDPVKAADDATREILGGRGIGEVPIDQKSKLGQVFIPFQLEVGNFWHGLDDQAREYYKGAGNRDFQAIVMVLLANYVFNELAENTRGSRVVYDPINALVEGYQIFDEEAEEGDYVEGGIKALGRSAGEFLSNIVGGQAIASTLIPDDMREDLFGNQNPTRFGEGPLAVQTLQKIGQAGYEAFNGNDPMKSLATAGKNALSVLFPYGGRQVVKTYEGIRAMITGTAEDATGKLSYEVMPTIQNYIKATLFGKAATSEARNYFDERDDLFRRVENQDEARKEVSFLAEKKWTELKEIAANEGKEAAGAKYQEIAESDPELAGKITEVWEDEQKGLDGNDRLVKMLGVENGERAKYLSLEFNKLETIEEKAELWNELSEKGLITEDVAAQLGTLLQTEQ